MLKVNGFTLIEILLVISLLGLISSIFISSNITGYQIYVLSTDEINIHHYTRIITNRIGPYLREAKDLALNHTSGDLIRIALNNDIAIERDYDGIAYGIVSDKIYYRKKRVNGNWGNRITFTHEDEVIVDKLNFSYFEEKNVVVMDVTLKITNACDLKKYSYSERFLLRNEI